jgi:glycosyltransferase involved in cell wall biosynthesis
MMVAIRQFSPDVVHVHNVFPIISPAVYYACRSCQVPVVQTLHNYRLACCNGQFLRNDSVCEVCLRRGSRWPGALYGCYRGSRLVSALISATVAVHQLVGTWAELVDVYVALTAFAREKMTESGLPAGKIAVKPNFVGDARACGTGQGGYALFVGRLSSEKGIHTLLDAWSRLGGQLRLKLVGDGPLAELVKERARSLPSVELLGWQSHDRVVDLMAEAKCVIVPSVWFETFGLVVIEAFSRGTPVVASRIGALAELVQDGVNGLLFEPGNAQDLADKVALLCADPEGIVRMRGRARAEFEDKYTAARNHEMLMDIYRRAIGTRETASSRC